MENLRLLKSNLTILQKIVHWVEVSPNCPKTANTLKQVYITQPLDCLGTQVRPHSMWNVMLITFCVSFGSSFPKLPKSPNTCKIDITQYSEDLDTTVKVTWCEIWSWKPWITFRVTLWMIWGIWAQFSFPKLHQFQSTWEIGT